MSQITIRDIPEIIEYEIRKTASKKQISLSKAAILLLSQSLGIDQEKKRDIVSVFGTWDTLEYEEFRSNAKIFDEIDEEIWT